MRQLSVSNAVIDRNALAAVFSVTLNPPADHTVSVNFATVDGTAVAGGDYNAAFQTVTFAPGESEHKISVSLIALPDDAPAKRFLGRLSSPSGAPICISQATATLADNDSDKD